MERLFRNIKVDSNNKEPKEGEYIMVHAYKWNGWLYRTWHFPMIVAVKNQWVVVCSKDCTITSAEEKTIRAFKSQNKNLTFWFFSSKDWFNIVVTIKNNYLKAYVNLSSPFLYEEGAIKYFDFDIDFKINQDNKWVEIDQEEFLENKFKFKYPEELVQKIIETEKDIINKIKNKYFQKFLDKKLIYKLCKKYQNIILNDDRFAKDESNE